MSDTSHADNTPPADVCPDCGTGLAYEAERGNCLACGYGGTGDRPCVICGKPFVGDQPHINCGDTAESVNVTYEKRDRPAVTDAMIDAAMDEAYEHMPSYFGGSEEEDREYIATLIAAALKAPVAAPGDPVQAFWNALPPKSRLLITSADVDFDAVLLEALKAAAEALERQHEVQELSGTEAGV